MKNCTVLKNGTSGRGLRVAGIAALAVAATLALAQPVRAQSGQRVRGPQVPANLQVPAGHKAFFEGHATGTQNYVCLPSATGFAWTFFGPQATLFNNDMKQLVTHFLSPNPFESGTPRATWQHSKDTSTVWALAVASSSDPAFVAPGAIPWLLLQVAGAQDGPDGGHKLTPATFLHRVNTGGGIAPATGCALATDVGKKVLVPYTADYFFYKVPGNGDDDNW